MPNNFTPDYTIMTDSAYNRQPRRIPLYEHAISVGTMERLMNKSFSGYMQTDVKEFYRQFCEFFKFAGYDMVSFECGGTTVMPGAGALGGHIQGVILERADYDKYPWDSIVDDYFKMHAPTFQIMREVLPEGMKLIGGVGGGVFETVQDLVGYTDLCYMSIDDPELYEMMFKKAGDILVQIWTRLLNEFSDIFCVCRFGDDLGYKTQTLLPSDDVKKYVVPQYKRIVEVVHSHNKPFLLHSCGQIFEVMEDIINVAKINAKHSNEDVIAPYKNWLDKFGSRIGNFGGMDTDNLCKYKEDDVRRLTKELLEMTENCGGIAIGSGNSIPDYVPTECYLAMIETVREYRGDYKK